ncbi:DUF3035 domain-containing protein [Komagataeibacter sp. FNDCR2]|uniref:DUF3035 domain-containing protein n=1 Tax=Komagataeibacter sp. FNDCR2 TaxID=2878682 RepID=UPI001E5DA9D2|nr:DUF3035 domain-containing protein [Komagataeibacter sp. FNDCR2]MCE2575314.1 DUF3035 domain-containing protein [Komagataeibacter sp. FNDCR2]
MLMASGFMLSGCSGADVSRAFGLERSLPDEYTVTTRAPLSMPPSDELGAPNSNAVQRAEDTNPRMQALETLSPNVALQGADGPDSAGQAALVGSARQAANDPDKGEMGRADTSFVDKLMFWHGGGAGNLVNGKAENARLREDSALGRNLTQGATPTVSGPTK